MATSAGAAVADGDGSVHHGEGRQAFIHRRVRLPVGHVKVDQISCGPDRFRVVRDAPFAAAGIPTRLP
jgi:hypothetical protein